MWTGIRRPTRTQVWMAGIALCAGTSLGLGAIVHTIPVSYASRPAAAAAFAVEGAPASLELVREQRDATPAPVARRKRVPCAECGVIESTRWSERGLDGSVHEGPQLHAGGTAPGNDPSVVTTYETTIRFPDGSTATISEAAPRGWRKGTRVVVIGRPVAAVD